MHARPGFLMTGAKGVIGSGLLKRLADDPQWAGARIVAAGRRGLEAAGKDSVTFFSLDLGDIAQVQSFCGGPLIECGPWAGGALVAGTSQDGPFLKTREEDWDRILNVNAVSCGLILGALAARKDLILPNASFLLVSSISGLRGNPGQAAYAASKAALQDVMERFQSAFASAGARLNILIPPLVDSPLMANISPESRERLYSQRLLPDPDALKTCVESAAFLLSPASSYIHAALWHADSRVSGLPWPA